ncbi:relaxase/mobilization nuclease domain-containing protein [Apilactobacillus sp. M161]|uniref:Relaxase/mobilization nuclease domain-containing protein n=1 Tax=Apilactobacillus xinyiensis TaxID=2841032 RepID=A0ABT0I396_9LACO|nr:relaxase/mobilization nuclease domain-containing protein [Apilactobacillus xinyiensis]MCK8625209.1 relaxase/mobilization nuclease domain-containing protein [Apilactobacillus xinyiensis]
MPTIKISRAQNGSAAIDYALGKNKLKEIDKQFLLNNKIDPKIVNTLNDRAVVKQCYNLIDVNYAKSEMKQTRMLANNRGKTQCMRFIQSFADYELNVKNPNSWQQANDMGIELAKKIAPNNEFAVYTHIDGEGHKVHNHIIMNMTNLKTGKKYHHNNDFRRVAKFNDEIAQKYFALTINLHNNNQIERKTIAERKLKEKNKYVWKDDLRKRIDNVIITQRPSSKLQFKKYLKQKGVIYNERGKNCSYSFLDVNKKHRTSRGTKLGQDYEKEHINDELVRQANELKQQADKLNPQCIETFDSRTKYYHQRTSDYNEQTEHSNKVSRKNYQPTIQQEQLFKPHIERTREFHEDAIKSYQNARAEQQNLSKTQFTLNEIFERIRRNIKNAIKYEVQRIKAITKQAMSKINRFLDNKLSFQGEQNIYNKIINNKLDLNKSIKELKKDKKVFQNTDKKYQISSSKKIIDKDSLNYASQHSPKIHGPHL